MIKVKLIILLCFVGFLKANAQEDYPVLNQIVTDNAQIFSQQELLQLRQKLKNYETETTHQIVVLTIKSLGNNTIEDYAYQTFNKKENRIGQKEADNGILILFSELDREVRIEVGDGFTPIITDAFASRIIRHIMVPVFKEQNYFQGIDEATSEIIKLIDSPEYRDEFANIIEQEDNFPLWGKILFGLFITAFLGAFIFIGGRILIAAYKQLINVFKGLITGKVSVLMFPLLLIVSLVGIAVSLPFVVMPLIFAYIIITQFNEEEPITNPITILEQTGYLNVNTAIVVAVIAFIFIPFVIAYFTRSRVYTPIKFSLTKSDKSFMSKNFSSGGISSGGSSFSSGSSSSSFSGGGGSSGGGGASGSW